MVLTAAVSAGKGTIDPAYNIPEMSKSLDLINVMAYDMHGAWDDYTHHQSGLYAHPLDEGDNLYFNVVGTWARRHFLYLKWLDEGLGGGERNVVLIRTKRSHLFTFEL